MKALKVFIIILSLLLLFYVALPAPAFPKEIPGSVQSQEPGDSEELAIRRAYFTDYTRQEALDYYQSEFAKSPFLGIPLPTYRLNYPPEDSQTLVRDQTRSTFLEEIVHPLRESFFVNGFEPKVAKDEIWYKGVHYRQKITVRYYPSNVFVRIFVALGSIALITILLKETVRTFKWISR